MQLSVTNRHIEISDTMKTYAEEKAGKVDRFYDRIETLDVILDQEALQYRVEMVARADHKHVFVGQADSADFYDAVDRSVEKLCRQLTRHKERFRNRKHTKVETEGQGAAGGS